MLNLLFIYSLFLTNFNANGPQPFKGYAAIKAY